MTAASHTPAPDLTQIAAILDQSIVPSTRVDGWNAAKQRRFLEAIADGGTVADACAAVRLSPQSAYAFRRRAAGRAFDLGWRAADLLARERVAADLLTRASEGQVVEITRADGSTVTKHHYDNRLAVQMLTRLDRYADASEATAPGHAARLVAGDFDAYLDLVGGAGGPARAGLFMLARAEGREAAAAGLEPVLALARADRHLRCGSLATDIDLADLDPARRAEWTAAQWARAEAAGLLVLAPPPAPEPPVATHQPVSTSAAADLDAPVWWDHDANAWRTRFPPREDFCGEEEGEYGDADYARELDEDELAIVETPEHARRRDEEAERDQWFAAFAADHAALDADADADQEGERADTDPDHGHDNGEAPLEPPAAPHARPSAPSAAEMPSFEMATEATTPEHLRTSPAPERPLPHPLALSEVEAPHPTGVTSPERPLPHPFALSEVEASHPTGATIPENPLSQPLAPDPTQAPHPTAPTALPDASSTLTPGTPCPSSR